MTQLELPLEIDREALTMLLDRLLALEDEADRVRLDVQEVCDQYALLLPMRAVRTAVKVTRARWKLRDHPREPMPTQQQTQLEALVEAHLARVTAERQALLDEAEGAA